MNGSPVRTPADVVEQHHRASDGTRLSYLLLRLGSREALEVTLAPAPRASSMYFVLACVGLFTLVVGAAVRVRRPRDPATLHFFWLCVAFFGAFTFSFNGPLDRLDWVFYWGDAVAQALLPPLLLHFMLVFPERPASVRSGGEGSGLRAQLVIPLLYLPALALGTGRILALTRATSNGPLFSQVLGLLDRLQLAYLFVSAAVALIVLVRTFRELTSPTARRQTRWMAWGTVFGIAPFALGYALPWAFGIDPPLALQFTAIPLGLVPLTFACALVRYRLRDIEVIVKRGLIYGVFVAASIAVYFGMRNLSGYFFPDDNDPRNWIVAVLATAVVVLLTQPVREALQNALDRLFYRDRYDYRRALVGFARDLNTDLDVVRLSQRLVSRIVETLVLDRMALLLADERSHDFSAIGDFGFSQPVPKLPRHSSFLARLDAGHTVALDDPIATARFEVEEVELWRDAGIYGLVPCVFEDRRDRGARARSQGRGPAVQQRRPRAADGGCRPGGDGDRERPAVSPAASEGRGARRTARVQREHPRVARRRVGGVRRGGADRPLEPGARRLLWRRAIGGDREEARRRVRGDVRRGAARRCAGEPGRLDAAPRAVGRPQGGRAARLLVNATAVPLQGGEDVPASAGTILLIENITDRVRLVEQLQLSEKMASIGVLAAGVAHEVNTPLTGISSFTQMLLENADPADPRTALLEKIERQTFRAAKIVNGLLNLSRPGPSGTERSTVDVNAVIADVFSLLEHQLDRVQNHDPA